MPIQAILGWSFKRMVFFSAGSSHSYRLTKKRLTFELGALPFKEGHCVGTASLPKLILRFPYSAVIGKVVVFCFLGGCLILPTQTSLVLFLGLFMHFWLILLEGVFEGVISLFLLVYLQVRKDFYQSIWTEIKRLMLNWGSLYLHLYFN